MKTEAVGEGNREFLRAKRQDGQQVMTDDSRVHEGRAEQ